MCFRMMPAVRRHRREPRCRVTSFAYLSDNRFLSAPVAAPEHPFAVAGINWDGSTTNRPGARFAPQDIRRASQMLCDGEHPHFNCTPLGHLGDAGDLPLPNTGLEGMRQALPPLLAPLLKQHHMVWLGGDHSITLPLLRAQVAQLGQPLAVIHFDAHCDTWEDHFGEPSGHGTWVYEAMQEGLVIKPCFFQLGIRSAGLRAAREYVQDQGGMIFTARQLRGLEGALLQPVVDAVRARLAAHGNPPVYLSFDIDALDPAYAPGTGTPEPAGLTSTQAFTLLEDWADLPFVGMDCVEVSPPYDHAQLTSYTAAQLVWTYLCGRVKAGT
jgi:agmatinase